MLFGEGPKIKNIAADLNNLFRQGSQLNQSGQTVEGDSTADQGTSDLLAARDPVIQEISVGMSGEQAARYTVSGAPPLSLPNSLGKPLKAWAVDLLPYQEGTGDPSPDNVRPIHGTDKLTITTAGKNLYQGVQRISINEPNPVEIYSVNIPYTCTFQFTASADYANSDGYWLVYIEVGNGTRTYITATAGQTTTKTISASPDNPIVSIYVRASGITAGEVTKIQLEAGSTATSYVPYIAPSQTVITLPSTVYTATIGREGGESRWGERTLTGVESWSNYGNPTIGFYIWLDDMPNGTRLHGLANWLKTETSGGATGARVVFGAGNNVLYCIVVGNIEGVTTVEEWKAYLAEHPLQVVYPLTTPTEFAVPSATIPTTRGTATTWTVAEDGTVDSMSVTYVGKA